MYWIKARKVLVMPRKPAQTRSQALCLRSWLGESMRERRRKVRKVEMRMKPRMILLTRSENDQAKDREGRQSRRMLWTKAGTFL